MASKNDGFINPARAGLRCASFRFIAEYYKYAPFGYRVSGMTRNSHALNLVPPMRDYFAI